MSHGVWVLGPGRFILRPPGRTVGGHHVLGRHTAVTAARRRLQEAARHRPGLASRGDAGQGQGRRFTRTTLRGRENRGRTFGALSGRGRRFGGALWVFQSISRSRSTFHRLFGYSCFFVLIHARHPRVGIHSGVWLSPKHSKRLGGSAARMATIGGCPDWASTHPGCHPRCLGWAGAGLRRLSRGREGRGSVEGGTGTDGQRPNKT